MRGEFSLRASWRESFMRDEGFRILGAGNFPSHRTISEFRMRHLPELKELFVAVARLARELGLVKLGTVALDGTKVKAHASKHKAMSYGRMKEQEQKLKAEIEALLERARQTDAQEDVQWGAVQGEQQLPEELKRRHDRMAKIPAVQARLEERPAQADRDKGRHAMMGSAVVGSMAAVQAAVRGTRGLSPR